jgi:chemotaxis protein methyltransferase CheR
MRDHCVEFLRWALPRLRMRWAGFRKVRGQVCKRIRRRMSELGLSEFEEYRQRLEGEGDEWRVLDGCCRVSISRFYRDHGLWERLALRPGLRIWCAGCASGEEPYTLAILCPGLHILATDADAHLLERARAGRYRGSSLKELPADALARAFAREDGEYVIRPEYRDAVEWRLEDIRETMPDGPFDLIFCRYLVFTYFDASLQREIYDRLRARLAPGGEILIGSHERLPN